MTVLLGQVRTRRIHLQKMLVQSTYLACIDTFFVVFSQLVRFVPGEAFVGFQGRIPSLALEMRPVCSLSHS